MAFAGIVLNTIYESMKKKMFIFFFGISTMILLLLLFVLNIQIIDSGIGAIRLIAYSDQTVDLVQLVKTLEAVIAVILYVFGILVSVLATAGIIPNFQVSGYIDVVLSKPVSRTSILLAKYTGAVLVVGLNIFYLVLGVWMILSVKTGVWNAGFLASGWTILLSYAVIMALMTFFGILTRSTMLSVLISYVAFHFVSFMLVTLTRVEEIYKLLSPFWKSLSSLLYWIFPKFSELFAVTGVLVRGEAVSDWSVIFSSVIFGLVIIGLSVWLFSRKDY